MLNWLTNRSRRKRSAQQVYGSIVTQARAPGFYRSAGVPDTLEGRFELLVVHVSLVLLRLERSGEAARALRRAIVEAFVETMDDAMRALGVGDLAVGRKVRALSEALQGRYKAYATALAADDEEALIEALLRNMFSGRKVHRPQAQAIAGYMRRARDRLAGLDEGALHEGRLEFPPAPEGDAP